VVTVNGQNIRLYSTSLNTGVGRRGRTETYVEANSNLLPNDNAALLWLLFSAQALEPNGSLKQILEESTRYAGALAENLRERIYGKVIPNLAKAVVDARRMKRPTAEQLSETYEIALIILFRLLFIAYAEDKDLLPFRYNGLYQKRSLKTKALELLDTQQNKTPFEKDYNLWTEIQLLFNAVDQGNKTWGVPHYNGGLFSKDPEVSKSGSVISGLKIPDTEFGEILTDLLLIEQDGTIGPVDFASLGVREFGTVYEGLLESELSLAETDLSLNADGAYVPTTAKTKIVVKEGEVYLHNSSGVRKSTGSYFTKDFAVQYLIDRSLVPALKEHFSKLDKMGDSEAAENLFDFKVADIAMGSGHFLTAAIDRMEADISSYLARRPLKGVKDELDVLRRSAREALGEIADQIGHIEDDNLLRRLIARRCIYGVDLNPLSVQLARLAVWIHTFVPGLPLSLLDRNLVVGNSLIGIGTIGEIQKRFQAAEFGEDELKLINIDAGSLLEDATLPLQRLAKLNDSSYEDIERARKATKQAEDAVEPAKALCTIITALPLAELRSEEITGERIFNSSDSGKHEFQWNQLNRPLKNFRFEEWEESKHKITETQAHKRAKFLLGENPPFHFPVSFPEVFLRKNPGFDVILGNPPWDKVKVEEKNFWCRYFPGLKGISQREYELAKNRLSKQRSDLQKLFEHEVKTNKILNSILRSGANPLGAGDSDLYKAFIWRFWDLLRDGGAIGVVLPRSAFSSKGTEEIRKRLLDGNTIIDCTTLINKKEWVFEGIHQQYSISLAALQKTHEQKTRIYLRGPFSELIGLERFGFNQCDPITPEQVKQWNDSYCFPLLPRQDSMSVFLALRNHPRLDSDIEADWAVKPITELHATNDSTLLNLNDKECPKGYWKVYKGESFDLWNPDTGIYYAWAEPKKVLHHLKKKIERSLARENSPYFGLGKDLVLKDGRTPSEKYRIAFRDITNRTNKRTFICSLIPKNTFLTHNAPFFLFKRGTPQNVAYLLGILSSLVLDWYARRYIELNTTYFLINPFPIPRVPLSDIYSKRVVEISARLSSIDERFREWASELNSTCGTIEDNLKYELICELDSVVAHLYGLTKSQLSHIFETFHVGWDYTDRLKKTLVHYDNWKK
jgi:hypothetical protein